MTNGAAATVIAIAWGALTVFLVARKRHEPLWAWTAVLAIAIGVATASPAWIGLVPAAAAATVIALPDGRLTKAGRILLVLTLVACAPFVAIIVGQDHVSNALIAIESGVAALLALIAFATRCRNANALDRARLQWAGWGAVVGGAIAVIVLLLHALIGWPDALGVPTILATIFVPIALALASVDRLVLRIDRLLVRTIEAGGLVVLVGLVYFVVVLGFGNIANDAERHVLGLSIVAAAIAAVLFVPARNRLEEIATRRVYGERTARDEPLQTFGARMSRAIPLDELLLQLAESLKRSLLLSSAEVWTGADGVLERAAAVPYRGDMIVRLSEEEVDVISRAHVSGNAWMEVWCKPILEQYPDRMVRVAPLVHSGELLGLVVCARNVDQQPFSDEEERVLAELARQVALALHNSALDTALQASLDDLKRVNEELRASRARIVAAADTSRRQIERNLHDGAQQHLVALAVKLGLARQLVESDPATVATLLEELRGDAQTTLTELRELAHGIYPPLLMDRGLREALVAAANRAVLPTDVEAEVGRYPAEVEAAVYFCCLEAMQNAGKYAGDGARINVRVHADDHVLAFGVDDDGAGFQLNGRPMGHGFINMADRLGAIGGSLHVESTPGQGAHIAGTIPLTVQTAERPSQS